MLGKAIGLLSLIVPNMLPDKGVVGVRRKALATAIGALLLVFLLITSIPCAFVSDDGAEYSQCVTSISKAFIPWLDHDITDGD